MILDLELLMHMEERRKRSNTEYVKEIIETHMKTGKPVYTPWLHLKMHFDWRRCREKALECDFKIKRDSTISEVAIFGAKQMLKEALEELSGEFVETVIDGNKQVVRIGGSSC